MLLAQASEAVSATAKALEGRSESTFLVVIVIALVAGIYYLQYRDNCAKSERQERRDEAREDRDAKKAESDSKSLQTIADGMQKCGDASQQFAGIARSLETTMENHNEETKRALLYAFRGIESYMHGNEAEAKQSIMAGRVLLEGRKPRSGE